MEDHSGFGLLVTHMLAMAVGAVGGGVFVAAVIAKLKEINDKEQRDRKNKR